MFLQQRIRFTSSPTPYLCPDYLFSYLGTTLYNIYRKIRYCESINPPFNQKNGDSYTKTVPAVPSSIMMYYYFRRYSLSVFRTAPGPEISLLTISSISSPIPALYKSVPKRVSLDRTPFSWPVRLSG